MPVTGYGGLERQVQWLALELHRQGHQVTIVSEAVGPLGDIEMRAAARDQLPEAIPADADIVNFHARWPREGDDFGKPFLNTAHNIYPHIDVRNAPWSFVSAFHAKRQGGAHYVHNGFPLDDYPLCENKSDRLLFMAGVGRPGKNLTRAVALAHHFDFPLDVAGGRRWGLLNRSKVRKELLFFKTLTPRFRFHGIVDGGRKMKLLGQAKAFLNPIRVEETFGMAPVEAMLCGTPVLATPLAAMPEIVTRETGFLFETDAEFAEALEGLGDLEPRWIRESAADRFSIERTAKGYLDLYARVLDGDRLVN